MKKSIQKDTGCFEKFRNMFTRWQNTSDGGNEPLTNGSETNTPKKSYRQKKPPFLSLPNVVIEAATNSISPVFFNDSSITPRRFAHFTVGSEANDDSEEEENSSKLYLEYDDILSPLPDSSYFNTPRSRNSARCYFSFDDDGNIEVSNRCI